jgi:predicted methyltransferase
MQEGARVAICTQEIKLSASKYVRLLVIALPSGAGRLNIRRISMRTKLCPPHSHTTAHVSVVTLSMGMRLVPMFGLLEFTQSGIYATQ